MMRARLLIGIAAISLFWSNTTTRLMAEPCLPYYYGVKGAETLTASQCRAFESFIMGREILRECQDLDWNYNAMQAMKARELLNLDDFRRGGLYYEVGLQARRMVSHSLDSLLDTTMGTGYRHCSTGKILFGSGGSREEGLLITK